MSLQQARAGSNSAKVRGNEMITAAAAKRIGMLTLSLALLSRASPALADEAPREAPGVIKVAWLDGTATSAAPSAVPVALSVGSALHEGEVVATGEGARLEIALASGTLLRLGGGTRLELHTAPTAGSKFSARLAIGNLWAKVHKLLAGDEFKIETENGVAGVRGTEFRVEAAPGKEDLVRVYEGAVEVADAKGAWSHRVEPGRELSFRKGAAPAGVRPFEPSSEVNHPLMKWVRERPMKSGQPGRVHELLREKEKEKEKRKHAR